MLPYAKHSKIYAITSSNSKITTFQNKTKCDDCRFELLVLELIDKRQIPFCPHCYKKNERYKCEIDEQINSNSNTENE